jgi:hypothetical protein
MLAVDFIKESQEYQMGKVCTKCKEYKLLSEFSKATRYKDGLAYQCRSCAKEYTDNVCRYKKWFDGKKGRAKRDGIEFTIKPEDIPGVKIREVITINKYPNQYRKTYKSWEGEEYPKVCFKWGIELDWGMKGVAQYNSPSLDRIDPTKGYVPGNVRIVCQSYNMAKGNCPPNEWDVIEKTIARNILFGEVGR